jgi:D-amino-acid dehydrogenase
MLASPGVAADVVVIGAGAIGVCTALELARRGASVVVLERGPEVAWGCSSGNAGIVGASHVLPLAGPQAIRDGLRWLGKPDSPFSIAPRAATVPWLAEFVAASAPRRVRAARSVLRRLALTSADLHAEWHTAGLDSGFERRGLLNVYGSEAAFRAARTDAAADRADGLDGQILDRSAALDAFPELGTSPAGAVFYPGEAHSDPARFVRAVAAEAVAAGVQIRTGVEVLGIHRKGSRVDSLWTTEGAITAGQTVLAAGAWSRRLAKDLRLRLPVQGGKGYHVDVEASRGDPGLPVWFQEDRVVATPLPGRLRLAGTLQLSGVDRRIDRRRVDAIVSAAQNGLRDFNDRRVTEVWRGLRPCTPDGLPVIGKAPDLNGLIVATGHGMWGLQLAPITGRLVAQIACGDQTDPDLHAVRPGRFARPSR